VDNVERKVKLNNQKASEFLEKIRVSRQGEKINPNKYILLLSIITLLNKDDGHENRFAFTELEPIFLTYYNTFFSDTPAYCKMLEYPFYHMKNDGFWFLQIKQGQEKKYRMYEKKRLTKKRLFVRSHRTGNAFNLSQRNRSCKFVAFGNPQIMSKRHESPGKSIPS
jgi:predicted restriction endonuclease